MNQRKLTFLFIFLAGILLMSGCRSSPEATPTPPPETAPTVAHTPTTAPPAVAHTPITSPPSIYTPDFCVGWNCTITGVVYAGTADPGNELAGVLVGLFQYSNCSPTRGEHETLTDEGGNFAFEVFLHDTDSFNFKVELEGYEEAKTSFGGFDCVFCACQPVEIVLLP